MTNPEKRRVHLLDPLHDQRPDVRFEAALIRDKTIRSFPRGDALCNARADQRDSKTTRVKSEVNCKACRRSIYFHESEESLLTRLAIAQARAEEHRTQRIREWQESQKQTKESK